MKLSLDNFLYAVKQIVTGKNGPPFGSTVGGNAADGGFKHDLEVPLSAIVPPGATGTVSITPNALITDSTGGTGSSTFAAITAGTSYAQADLVAVKNALAETAAQLNIIRTALTKVGSFTFNTGTVSGVPAFITGSGVNPAVGIIPYTIPRDYDEASDSLVLRVYANLANADASITLTGTPTIQALGGSAVAGTAVTATKPFGTAAAPLTTTEAVYTITLSKLGLVRDSLLAVSLALVGTTTGNTYVYDVEITYDSTLVSYNETDGTSEQTGNPLR